MGRSASLPVTVASQSWVDAQRNAGVVTVYLVIGAAVLVLGFAVWLSFKSAEGKGRAEAEKQYLQRKTDEAERANAIDEDVLRLSDGDLDRELRDGR